MTEFNSPVTNKRLMNGKCLSCKIIKILRIDARPIIKRPCHVFLHIFDFAFYYTAFVISGMAGITLSCVTTPIR